MSGLYDESCPICHGSGYEVKDLNLYEYYGSRAEVEIKKSTEGIKDKDERQEAEALLREAWQKRLLQPTAIPCPKCNGRQRVVDQRKKAAHLPEIMAEATMLDFDWNVYVDVDGRKIDTSRKQQLVNSFLSQFSLWKADGMGLYISSKIRGSGKTFLASAICNALMVDKYVRVQFIPANELIPISSGEYSRDNVTIDTLMNVDVLTIDDLGQKNNGKGWIEDILFEVLDARMNSQRITIVTSNYAISELEYDSRIVDRLNNMTVNIALPEVSVRLNKANDRKAELYKKVGIMR